MKNVNNEMLLDYIDFTPSEFEELMQQPKMYSKEEEHLKKLKQIKKIKKYLQVQDIRPPIYIGGFLY